MKVLQNLCCTSSGGTYFIPDFGPIFLRKFGYLGLRIQFVSQAQTLVKASCSPDFPPIFLISKFFLRKGDPLQPGRNVI